MFSSIINCKLYQWSLVFKENKIPQITNNDLIEYAKNGNIEVFRLLLDKGAIIHANLPTWVYKSRIIIKTLKSIYFLKKACSNKRVNLTWYVKFYA